MQSYFSDFDAAVKSDAYNYLGSFLKNGKTTFRVWAPCAQNVSVVGEFNAWNITANPMSRIENGVWEVSVKGVSNFDIYKYAVTAPDGKVTLKSDPYARHFETAPDNASKVYANDGYLWNDDGWRDLQSQSNPFSRPLNIYEVHLDSWRRFADGNTYDYVTAAKELSKYVKDMNYTHIELMPITE